MLLEEDNCRTNYTVHFPLILQHVLRLIIIFPYPTGPVYFDWEILYQELSLTEKHTSKGKIKMGRNL
jgi:hypothetical protein